MEIGTTLGSYHVIAKLGEGGMGEVYRARDTKLKRDVALKILPEQFTSDPDRLARFQREAEVLATLNHPHIAHIHGLEDAGTVRALVMELVDGDDLAQRIARGPIPLDDALPIARQIAEALEAAHEQGIIHRDLKPANIKVRADGTVKVLDFGLAKAMDPGTASASGAGLSALANSPTITSPMLTMQGMLLGTAAYMSPEQAKGKTVDKRSDIWAFGCVLYEMLTGRRAFDGGDVTETLAAIVRGEPDWRQLPQTTPAAIVRMLRRCLARDRAQRLADIRDARLDLDEAAHESVSSPAPSSPPARSHLVPVLTALILASGLTSLAWWWSQAAPTRPEVTRVTLTLPAEYRVTGAQFPVVAWSPDGARLAVVANNRLLVREMSDLSLRPITGAQTPGTVFGHPLFSPDGRWIAFYTASNAQAAGAIRKIPSGGGAPVTVVDGVRLTGMSWHASGIIYAARGAGILRVEVDGSAPETLVAPVPDELMQGPRLLPDGSALLFTVGPDVPFATNFDQGESDIVVQSLGSSERKSIIKGGSDAFYLPTGHIVYTRAGVLLAAPFDLRRQAMTGESVALIEGVGRYVEINGSAQIAISAHGHLAYVPGVGTTGRYDVMYFDRRGAVEPLDLPEGASYVFPRVSPDGTQISLGTDDRRSAHVWIYDVSRASAPRQLTSDGRNRYPVWSSDGSRVTFQSDRDGAPSIYWQRADGMAPAERLTTAEEGTAHVPETWSPDGRHLLFSATVNQGYELWMLSAADGRTTRLLDKPSPSPFAATFSPDGKWFAYGRRDVGGNVAGSMDIFVEPFPRTGAIHRVTNGVRPLWSRSGSELFFARPGQSFVVSISMTPTPKFGNPVEIPIRRSPPFGLSEREYDTMKDGRFVFSMPEGRTALTDFQVELVLNWLEELKDRVPRP